VAIWRVWTDSIGRHVRLETDTWFDKIVPDHPEMEGQEDAIGRALADPDLRSRDRIHEDREIVYRSGLLQDHYAGDILKVVFVVDRSLDARGSGKVIAAYLTDRIARGEPRLWTRPQ
jgi:hypothetical protein